MAKRQCDGDFSFLPIPLVSSVKGELQRQNKRISSKMPFKILQNEIVLRISACFQYNCAKNGKGLKTGRKEADTT